jgi:hypothetical protein
LFQFFECLVAVSSDFTETLAAIYWSAFTGFERYFRFFTTFGANRRVHLARFTAGAHALGFPVLSAGRAAFGFVGVTLTLEELLLGSGEGE